MPSATNEDMYALKAKMIEEEVAGIWQYGEYIIRREPVYMLFSVERIDGNSIPHELQGQWTGLEVLKRAIDGLPV